MPVESTGTNEEGGRIDLCLVGRFISNKSINFVAMQTLFSEVWKPMAGVHIKEVVGERFLLQFFHFVDVNRVLKGGHGRLITALYSWLVWKMVFSHLRFV